MSALPDEVTSYWIASTPGTEFPPLDGEVAVDVAVIGAGITGITAALLLAREGLSVAVSTRTASGSGPPGTRRRR